jgi:hypothetical protein
MSRRNYKLGAQKPARMLRHTREGVNARQAGGLLQGTGFDPYFGHLKGFAPASMHTAKHKLIFL